MRRLTAVLAAAGLVACTQNRAPTSEDRRREAWVRTLADREGLSDAWSLMSRADIQFEDGLSPIDSIDPAEPFEGWRETVYQVASAPMQRIRWMGPRNHIRLRGDADMRLEIRGRVDLGRIYTRPLVSATFAGLEFHSEPADVDGYFVIRATLSRDLIADWSDVYVTLSSVDEPWRDPAIPGPARLAVARLEGVIWEPVSEQRTER